MFTLTSVASHDKKPMECQASSSLVHDDAVDDELPCDASGLGDYRAPGRRLNLPSYLSSKSRRTVQAGALSPLKDLPIDILYEIFSNLHPIDLLALSRTTKPLRSLLLSKNSIYVWQQSLELLEGFPECPPDMSEPEYCSLAFDATCHFCDGPAPHVLDVFWTCRSRCCQSCIHSQFLTEYELEQKIPELGSLRRKETIIPYIVYPKPTKRRPGRILFSVTAAEQIAQELDSESMGSECALVDWQKEKLAQQMERLHHARLCESWCSRWSYRRPEDFTNVLIPVLLAFLTYIWRDQIIQ